jgi:hypothetical protein
VFELLKRHLCFEVSAIAMIDLDDHIFGSQNRFYQVISSGHGDARQRGAKVMLTRGPFFATRARGRAKWLIFYSTGM